MTQMTQSEEPKTVCEICVICGFPELRDLRYIDSRESARYCAVMKAPEVVVE